MSPQETWSVSVAELARETHGQVVSSPVNSFSRVGTDTRQDLRGRLFVALRGEAFNAHDFVAQAVEHKLGSALGCFDNDITRKAVTDHDLGPTTRNIITLDISDEIQLRPRQQPMSLDHQ